MSKKKVREPSNSPRVITIGEYEALTTQLSDQDSLLKEMAQAVNTAFGILNSIAEVLVTNGLTAQDKPTDGIALPGDPEFDRSLEAVGNPNPLH